jgi:radical SAM superfamily enzyme YgiQ (UPF0313 family)
MKNNITLIFPSSSFLINQGVFPPLGIMCLSGALKDAGVDVQCLDFGIGHTKEMAEFDTVGISFTTPQRREAFELIKYYKSLGKTVIVGGAHATHMSAECFKHGADFVVCGYGEKGLLNYFNRFSLDVYYPPDRDSLPLEKYNYTIDGEVATTIMTSRGCPYDCLFCGRIDKSFEMLSYTQVIQEIEDINAIYGYKAFMIFDDVFTINIKRLYHISEAFRHSGFKFRCFSRANLINPTTCDLLHNMGVVEVGLGIESGSQKILDFNMKNTTVEANTKAVKLLQERGIRAKCFIIVGLPGETKGTFNDTVSWLEYVQPDDVDATIFQPLPGSDIFNFPEKYGINFSYDGNDLWYKGITGKYSTSVSSKHFTSNDLVSMRDYLEGRFKNKELLR